MIPSKQMKFASNMSPWSSTIVLSDFFLQQCLVLIRYQQMHICSLLQCPSMYSAAQTNSSWSIIASFQPEISRYKKYKHIQQINGGYFPPVQPKNNSCLFQSTENLQIEHATSQLDHSISYKWCFPF